MVAIKAAGPSVVIALAVSSSVAAPTPNWLEQDLEARNPTVRLALTAANVAKTAARTAVRARPMSSIGQTAARMRPITSPISAAIKPPIPASGPSMGTKLTAGMALGKAFGGKLIGGAIVGAGAQAAQTYDNTQNPGRRDIEFELEERNPTALRAGIRLVAQVGKTAAAQTLRTAGRPASMARVARPVAQAAPKFITPPPTTGSSILSKLGTGLKTAGTVGGIGSIAGAGEYYGGKLSNVQAEKFEDKKRGLEDEEDELFARIFHDEEFDLAERDLYDDEEVYIRGFDDDQDLYMRDGDAVELLIRNPTLLRGAARLATSAARTAITRPAVARPLVQAVARPPANQLFQSAAKKIVAGAGVGATAFSAGGVEGYIQNATPNQGKSFVHSPLNYVQTAFGKKRDLEGRGWSQLEQLD